MSCAHDWVILTNVCLCVGRSRSVDVMQQSNPLYINVFFSQRREIKPISFKMQTPLILILCTWPELYYSQCISSSSPYFIVHAHFTSWYFLACKICKGVIILMDGWIVQSASFRWGNFIIFIGLLAFIMMIIYTSRECILTVNTFFNLFIFKTVQNSSLIVRRLPKPL